MNVQLSQNQCYNCINEHRHIVRHVKAVPPKNLGSISGHVVEIFGVKEKFSKVNILPRVGVFLATFGA